MLVIYWGKYTLQPENTSKLILLAYVPYSWGEKTYISVYKYWLKQELIGYEYTGNVSGLGQWDRLLLSGEIQDNDWVALVVNKAERSVVCGSAEESVLSWCSFRTKHRDNPIGEHPERVDDLRRMVTAKMELLNWKGSVSVNLKVVIMQGVNRLANHSRGSLALEAVLMLNGHCTKFRNRAFALQS